MTTRKLLTAACALALGFAWTMAPAIAADESVKDKAKDKADTAKDKMGNAADKTKDKAVEIKDKIKEKVSGKKNGDTVAKGSDDVRQAQQALTEKGFNPGPVDGRMGPHTKAAISDFQKKENLKVTGSLDRETKSKLVNASVSKKADTAAPAASPSTTTPTDTTAPATGAAPTSPSSDKSTGTEKK